MAAKKKKTATKKLYACEHVQLGLPDKPLIERGTEVPARYLEALEQSAVDLMLEQGILSPNKPKAGPQPGLFITKDTGDAPVFDELAGTEEAAASHISFSDEIAEPEETPAPETKEGWIAPSAWIRDPTELEGLSLEELNIQILAVDDTIEPFETQEEAVAWLSQDYGR